MHNSKRIQKEIHLSIFLENNYERQRVCKALILDNLNIRGKVSYTLIEQKWLSAVREQKGKKICKSGISEEDINLVRKHIESFPRIQSHYIRKRSKKHLEKHLSITQMYELNNLRKHACCMGKNIVMPLKKWHEKKKVSCLQRHYS